MKKKILTTLVLCLIVGGGLVLAFQQTRTQTSGNKVNVIASFYPLYEFSKAVGGDTVSVRNMTPSGVEPHDYEPTPRDLNSARQADVIVLNGRGFEHWSEGFLKEYKNTVVTATSALPKGDDPHAWLDPVAAQSMVRAIQDGLKKADPDNAGTYEKNAQAYIEKLRDLDRDYTLGLAECRHKAIVTSHDAFGYVSSRYGVGVNPIAGLSPEEEPTPQRLAELSMFIKERGLRHVFFESLVSPRLADTIAAETGAQTLVLDPIEGLNDEDKKAGKTYLDIQRENLKNLRTALACR